MIKENIKELMRKVFEQKEIKDNVTQLNNENWDSLRHLNLIVAIEEEFEISLEPDEIEVMTSLAKIVEIVDSKN